MTDTEKLAAIDSVLEDLLALKRHQAALGNPERFEASEADSLRRIAEIVGFSLAPDSRPAAPTLDRRARARRRSGPGTKRTPPGRPARKRSAPK